jgi:hypothetical protein
MIAYSNNHKKEYRTDSEIIKHQQIIFEVYGGDKDESSNEEEIIKHISKKPYLLDVSCVNSIILL